MESVNLPVRARALQRLWEMCSKFIMNLRKASNLVDKALLLSSDALAEHIIRPALVGKHNGNEDQGDDRHDGQCVL